MTFLPIVARELRVAARRRGTYWRRVIMGGAGLLVAGWVTLVVPRAWFTAQEVGQTILAGLSALVFLYCWLAGPLTTADCLSREKREGTLGLLFLTDLKGYDIVFGKLAATSLNALGGLLAVLPVAAVPLLVGGVSAQQVGRVALVELNTLFFSLAAGMLASAVARGERQAVGLCLAILGTFTLGAPLVGELIGEWLGRRDPAWGWVLPSPGLGLVLAYEPAPAKPELVLFYKSVAVVHGLSWAFLAVACRLVPHTWQEQPATIESGRRSSPWKRLVGDWPDRRARFRERLLAINPFYWLAARQQRGAVLTWLFLGACAVLWLAGYLAWPNEWLDAPTYVFTGLVLNGVLKWAVASEASWRLSQDRPSGVLELLLVTPLTTGQMVGGQLRALVRHFAGPAAVVVAVEVLFLLTDPRDTNWVAVWIAGIVMLVADLATLSVLGMWLGLTRRSHTRALFAALGLVCVLPWVLFYLGVGVLEAYGRPATAFVNEEGMLPLLWLLLGLTVDVVFGGWAWVSLRTRFQHVVAERPVSVRLALG